MTMCTDDALAKVAIEIPPTAIDSSDVDMNGTTTTHGAFWLGFGNGGRWWNDSSSSRLSIRTGQLHVATIARDNSVPRRGLVSTWAPRMNRFPFAHRFRTHNHRDVAIKNDAILLQFPVGVEREHAKSKKDRPKAQAIASNDMTTAFTPHHPSRSSPSLDH